MAGMHAGACALSASLLQDRPACGCRESEKPELPWTRGVKTTHGIPVWHDGPETEPHCQPHWAEHTPRPLTMRGQAGKGLGPTYILRGVTTEIWGLWWGTNSPGIYAQCASLTWKTFWSLTRALGQWGLSCLATELFPTEKRISLDPKQLCL